MKTKVIFMERDGMIRLVVTNNYGVETSVMFEKVSSLVNYARECEIPVRVSDCISEGGAR